MSKDQLIAAYGQPDYTEKVYKGDGIIYTYGDYKPKRGSITPSLDFRLVNNKIVDISINSYID